MDYGKWLYQQKRRVREAHKKTQHPIATLKEIRLRPETDNHDLDVKVGHARAFLEKGHRVQFSVFFRGRQMLHKEMGSDMLNGIMATLQDVAKIERPSMMTGRRMTLLLIPK
jgi:translation initiation factor IF-3